jgi:RimJ/RimL family protein N-acetyltransferase
VCVAPSSIAYMVDTTTNRLVLHPIDAVEAERILGGAATSEDAWASGYPSESDLKAVGNLLAATIAGGDQRPWGYFQLRRRIDGLAIGGIEFFGPPDGEGTVEVGYGLVPDARGHGYAAEALAAVIGIARTAGAKRVVANTSPDNVASQRTMRDVGMPRVSANAEAWHYELLLDSNQ